MFVEYSTGLVLDTGNREFDEKIKNMRTVVTIYWTFKVNYSDI